MTKQDFADEDSDRDGKISLDEWTEATFHEDPQTPMYDDSGARLIPCIPYPMS
jgi:hypothetical protein